MRDVAMANFTSQGTEAEATLMLGFIPSLAIVFSNLGATNPDIMIWMNADRFPDVPDADGDNDSVLFLTGSTGVVTVVDDAIAPYAGGDVVVAADDEDTYKRDGTNATVGDIKSAGLTFKVAAQVNSGINFVLAFRDDIQ